MTDTPPDARSRALIASLNLSPPAWRRLVVASLLTPLIPALVSVAALLSDTDPDFDERFAAAMMFVWWDYATFAPTVLIPVVLTVMLKLYQAPFIIAAFALCELARWTRECVSDAAQFHQKIDIPPIGLVVDAVFGVILGMVFCFLAAPSPRRFPARALRSPDIVRKSVELARRISTIVLLVIGIILAPLSIFMRDNGSIMMAQPGLRNEYGSLRPANGRLMGFEVGQEQSVAIANACKLVQSGALVPIGRRGALAFDCARSEGSIFQGDIWDFRLKRSFPCIGLEPPTLHVGIDNGMVRYLGVDCGQIIGPM